MGLGGHMITLLVYETSIMFSIVAAQIYIPTNHVGGFLFLHTLFSISYWRLFNVGHSDQCEVISH